MRIKGCQNQKVSFQTVLVPHFSDEEARVPKGHMIGSVAERASQKVTPALSSLHGDTSPSGEQKKENDNSRKRNQKYQLRGRRLDA